MIILLWKNKKRAEPDYYAFFVICLSFFPIGVVLMIAVSPGFVGIMGLGLCYMATGLGNRDKWPKNKRR